MNVRIACAVILCMLAGGIVTSCDKDRNGPDTSEAKLDDRLVGTKWQCRDVVEEMFSGGSCYEVFEFVSTTEVEQYCTRNGAVISSNGTFAYTLNYPAITINLREQGQIKPTGFEFTDSRTMVRNGTDGKGYYSKYLRQ